MQLVLQRRAEVSFRSLSPAEQKQLSRALDEIRATVPKEFYRHPKLSRLVKASGGELYAYKGNQDLRLILSVDADTCTVEDVVNHDRLNALLPPPPPRQQ